MNNTFSLENQHFSEKIIAWYKDNQRDLPWRNTRDPYYIWLSEIILQQTRVIQGLPYYLAFVKAFPNVKSFASANQEEILRLWQGLGYYSRARNMHFTAKQVMELYDGRFPSTYQELLNLKGIGPYTAAAIASFAFDEPVPVVDGNVFRVLARVFGITTDISSSKARKVFTQVVEELIPKDNPAIFNQAIMEFGALQCTPKKPNCMFCSLQATCYAFQHQAQNELPVKLSKTKVRNRYLNYFAINVKGNYLMRKRTPGDIWEGLYDFYTVETEEARDSLDQLNDALINEILRSEEVFEEVASKKHLLSHQRIYVDFWHLNLSSDKWNKFLINPPEQYKWIDIAEIEDLPKSILTAAFFEKLIAKE